MPHGGKREGAGRPKGKPNASTLKRQARIRDLAKEYATVAIEALADILQNGESDAARVSAANSILDRGFGKPVQSMEVTNPDGSLAPQIDASKLDTATLTALIAAKVDNDEATTVH